MCTVLLGKRLRISLLRRPVCCNNNTEMGIRGLIKPCPVTMLDIEGM